MVVLASASGIAGLPTDVKEAGKRVDFRPDDFTMLIETKGYRLAWKRACHCPCVSVNDQTEQSDPNCTLCDDSPGYIMFDPAIAPDTKITGVLSTLQKSVAGTAGVIMGIQSSFFGKDNPYEQVQRRLEGTMSLTVRPENRLGYHDLIINLDTTITFAQVEKADGTGTLNTRYPVVCMNLLRSVDTVFVENTDFTIIAGVVTWTGTPPVDTTQLAMHYLTYPHWRVVEHPHITRSTLQKFKTKTPAMPAGDPVDLPIQALCKYEFLL